MMKRVVAAMAAALAAAGAIRAGTITGVVKAHGPIPPHASGAAGGYGSLKYKFAEVIDYGRLSDFVVYIDAAVPGETGPLPVREMKQHLVAFEPHVLAVPVGTRVRWPNLDTIYHNVFSMTEGDTFDLGELTDKDAVGEHVMRHPGRVDIFCAIHAKMHGIVLVTPSRFVTMVNARQRYVLHDVPAGTYPLRAWHERVPAQEKTVTVPAEGVVTVDFDLGPEGRSSP